MATIDGGLDGDILDKMIEVRPSVYFRLGVGNADTGCVHPLHHPEFRLDEDAMALGASVLVRVARRFLANK